MKQRFILCLVMIWGLMQVAAAVLPGETMIDPKQDARARALYGEVRCVVCQNESIADSSADIAADLRRDIREHLAQGLSDAEIRDRLRARYGDYVLFRPRFGLSTALLWLLPVGILIGGGLLFVFMTKKPNETALSDLSDAEREKLRQLLGPDA